MFLKCARVSTCVCVWAYTGTDTSLRCNLRVVEIRRTCTQLSSERDIFGQAHSVSLFCCHYWADSRPYIERDNPNRYQDHVLVNSLCHQRWLIWVSFDFLSQFLAYFRCQNWWHAYCWQWGAGIKIDDDDLKGDPSGGPHVWRTPVILPPLFLPPSSFARARPVNDDVVTLAVDVVDHTSYLSFFYTSKIFGE